MLLEDLSYQSEEIAGSRRIILTTDAEASLPGSTASQLSSSFLICKMGIIVIPSSLGLLFALVLFLSLLMDGGIDWLSCGPAKLPCPARPMDLGRKTRQVFATFSQGDTI